EHGGPDRKRLDDRVREVLPARRQDRRVGCAEELDDPAARLRAEEANASIQAEIARLLLERLTIGPLARDDEADPLDRGERLERAPERLLGGEPARERERRAVQAELAAEDVARLEVANLRRRVRQDADSIVRHSPRQHEVAQVRAGTEDVRRVAQLEVPRAPEQPRRRAAAAGLKVLDVTFDETAPP